MRFQDSIKNVLKSLLEKYRTLGKIAGFRVGMKREK